MNWINIPYFIFHFLFVADLCIVLLLPDLMVWIGWEQTSPQTGKNDFSPGKSKGYQALWFFLYIRYLIILYLKVGLWSNFYEPVYGDDFHLLLDSPTTFVLLAWQNNDWFSIFCVLFFKKMKIWTPAIVMLSFVCVIIYYYFKRMGTIFFMIFFFHYTSKFLGNKPNLLLVNVSFWEHSTYVQNEW